MPQQKQTNDRKRNADYSLTRRRFMKNQDACDGHDRRAACQNSRHRRERSALLKKKEERDGAGADANAGNQRVSKTSSAEFLTPSSLRARESRGKSRSTGRRWLRQ